MKKSYLFLVFLLSLVLTLNASLVSAEEPPDMITDFQIQNLDSSKDATVTITFYKADGTVAATISDVGIDAGGSVTYVVADFPAGVGDSFEGSVVIKSDTPVGAIINLFGSAIKPNGEKAPRGFGGGVYDSLSEGATTVSAPIIFSEFYTTINTFFFVQNTGSSEATVNITYSGDGGCTEQAVIPANASKKFTQETNSCLTGDKGYYGSATITSDVPVVATVVQYDEDSILIYNGFTNAVAHTNPVMPLYMSNLFNTFTGISIQNTGDTKTDITVTYTPSEGFWGNSCSQTIDNVAAGASVSFGNDYTSKTAECVSDTGDVANNGEYTSFLGSAKVTGNTASQPLVAIVNQVDLVGFGEDGMVGANPSRTNKGANASAYSAFSPDQGASEIGFPIMTNSFYSISTGFNLMNVGTETASVTCVFKGSADALTIEKSISFTVEPGTAPNIAQNATDTVLPANFLGSATCTATGGSIVAVANQVTIGGSGDTVLTYEAFAQ